MSWLLFFLASLCLFSSVNTAPVNCVYWNTLKVAYITAPHQYVVPANITSNLFLNHLADEKCGFANTGINVEVTYLACALTNAQGSITTAVKAAVLTYGVQIIIGPIGPPANIVASVIASLGYGNKVLLVSGTSGSNGMVYTPNFSLKYNFVYAMPTITSNIHNSDIAAVSASGYKTAAIISNAAAPDGEVCTGGIDIILENGLTLITPPVFITFPTNVTDEEVSAMIAGPLAEIHALQPDLLYSCFFAYCRDFFQVIMDNQYDFTSHNTFNCLSEPTMFNDTLSEAMLFVKGNFHWDQRGIGKDYLDVSTRPYANMYPYDPLSNNLTSAMQFYQDYLDPVNNPDQVEQQPIAAIQLCAWYAIERAIYFANSTNIASISTYLASTDMGSACGRISMDDQHTNYKDMVVLQMINANGATIIVNTDPIEPMPTFQERVYNHGPLTTSEEFTFLGLCSFSTLLSILFFIYIMVHRHESFTKQLSIKFTITMLIGCILADICPFFWIAYNTTTTCTGLMWIWNLAYNLIMGSVIMRTYQIHSIFNATKLTVVRLSDWQLLLRLAGFVVIGLVTSMLWTILDPLLPVMIVVDPYRQSYNYVACQSSNYGAPIFIAIYSIGLWFISMHYARRVRKVPSTFEQFDNAKFIYFLDFGIFLLIAVGAAFQFSTNDGNQRVIRFIIRSCVPLLMNNMVKILFLYNVITVFIDRNFPSLSNNSGIQPYFANNTSLKNGKTFNNESLQKSTPTVVPVPVKVNNLVLDDGSENL